MDNSPWKFFLLVLLLCLPFWLLGTLFDRFLPSSIPIHLPFAALIFLCPVGAALLLTRRAGGSASTAQLLRRTFDIARIRRKAWLLPALLFWPIMMLLEIAVLPLTGAPIPALQAPTWLVLPYFLMFFVGAAGEELGWLGYALEPLQARWGAARASLILGSVRALFHVVGFLQAHNSPTWIVYQCLGILLGQVIITWLYNNTGRSIFAAILLHAAYNVSTLVFPNYGFSYDPLVALVFTALAALVIVLVWGPGLTKSWKTLT